MARPFTYEQAVDIAEDFGDLVDTGLLIEMDGQIVSCMIQKVVVAPYPEIEMNTYTKAYKTQGNLEKVTAEYKGDDYNVLILAVSSENHEIIALPIQKYTAEYGINYRYP